MRDLFLSHSSVDKLITRRIAAEVSAQESPQGRRLTVWVDEAEIQPGRSIPGAINVGLESSCFIALLLSPSYFTSPSGWTDAEWHAVLHIDPDNRRGRILPILIADCPRIPVLLRHLRIIDMRGPHYPQGLQELIQILRGEPQPSAAIYRGQLILAGRHLSRQTLVAERSIIDAEPDPAPEDLPCNLLPVERLPTFVYSAPIAKALTTPRLDGSFGLPTKKAVKEAIRAHQERTGAQPFMPAFRMVEDQIITFHDLTSTDSTFSAVVDTEKARSDRASDWVQDPDDRNILTSLLNMSLSRHAYRLGLKEDDERPHRFYFTPQDGNARVVTWKPFRVSRPREVAGPRFDENGKVVFWRHAAAYLKMMFLATRYYLHIDPTWLFTKDGLEILRGSDVGRLAIRWTGAERNLHILYHIRFWAHVLRNGPGPIVVRAGDRILELSSMPAFIHQQFGIAGDFRDLDHSLDTRVEYIEDFEESALEAEAARRLITDASPAEELTLPEPEEGHNEQEEEARRSEDRTDASF